SVGAPVCASVVAELRTGGSVEIRFPIATALMDRAEDRSLHFAGIADGGVARTFESLDDLAGYLGYRQNMLMYWNPARHVVLAEVIETQYQPTHGHPITRPTGTVLRRLQ